MHVRGKTYIPGRTRAQRIYPKALIYSLAMPVERVVDSLDIFLEL